MRPPIRIQWFCCQVLAALRPPLSMRKREHSGGAPGQAPHIQTERSKKASESEKVRKKIVWEGGREPSPRQMSGWIHFITPLFPSLAQMAKVSKRDCDSAIFNYLSTAFLYLVIVKVKVAKDPLARKSTWLHVNVCGSSSALRW